MIGSCSDGSSACFPNVPNANVNIYFTTTCDSDTATIGAQLMLANGS